MKKSTQSRTRKQSASERIGAHRSASSKKPLSAWIDPDLMARLKRVAKKQGITASQFAAIAIRLRVEAEEDMVDSWE